MSAKIIYNWVLQQLGKKTKTVVTKQSAEFSTNDIIKRLKNYNIEPDDITDPEQLVRILDSVKQAEDNVFNNTYKNLMEDGMKGLKDK